MESAMDRFNLLESKQIQQLGFDRKTYDNSELSTFKSGVEYSPKNELPDNPIFQGKDLSIYIENHKVKIDITLQSKDINNFVNYFHILVNNTRLVFQNKPLKGFSFIDIDNFDIIDVYNPVEKEGFCELKMRWCLRGYVPYDAYKTVFPISKEMKKWLKLMGVRVYVG